MTERLSLARYQNRAVDALSGVIQKVAELHERDPSHRQSISLKSGVTLLQSPTGSGKTLVLGRVLEGLKCALSRPVVWLWFAPYSGLVIQTREALVAQCGGLRVRDVSKDREATGTRDGDVFIQTWATVAANNRDARKVRRTSETALSFDDLIDSWREAGFFVGVVIDEAHLNFGASASAAAKFYLDHIQPDFTILATATPNDDKLEAFERVAKIEVASRVIVPRSEVVDAGLNKAGLKLGLIRFKDGDRDLIDHEQATLQAGWAQHRRVHERLKERGLAVTPLMLVQVEDQVQGAEDPVKRVREKLLEIGVEDSAIAIHTSGQPDPDFHSLAYDPDIQVLIFKVAVATGFDAPRAWTLVSVRPNRGRDFGMQIVGRIMRVHPSVRPFHGQDPLLESGYVLLTDPDMQSGLQAAVDELKAVQESIDLITDNLDIYEFGNAEKQVVQADTPLPRFTPRPPQDLDDRQLRLTKLIDQGFVKAEVQEMSDEEQDRAIVAGETLQHMSNTPLFGDLPESAKPDAQTPKPKPGLRPYPIRNDLDLPKALFRELPPEPAKLNDLVQDIAQEFCRTTDVMGLLQRKLANAHLDLRDLFAAEVQETLDLRLRLSNARVAEKAQLAFKFNDAIDPRQLKRALVEELRALAYEKGADAEERDLRRAIDLAGMLEPEKLKDAIKTAQARNVRVDSSEPVPEQYYGPEGLSAAEKSAYGVFPHRLNKEELDFAKVLDTDTTGTVKWWMRNPENETWATRLILPSGHRFFPDFIVGVSGRTTPDTIALVEIKDDGDTGRLHSDRNTEKIRVHHREYRNVFWTYRSDGQWVRARYAEGLHKIVPEDIFDLKTLVYIT